MEEENNQPDSSRQARTIFKCWWFWVIIVVVIGGGIIYAMAQSTQNRAFDRQKAEEEKKQARNLSEESDDKNCPEKILLYSDDTIGKITDGEEIKIAQEELHAIFKECPGVEKESVTLPVTTSNPVATSPTPSTQRSSTSSSTQSSSTSSSTESANTSAPNTASSPPSSGEAASPPNDTLSIITPYVDESDIDWVPEAWSITPITEYWGFQHPGVDFRVTHTIPVQAAAGGTIENFAVTKESGQMGWHAGFCIKHNNTYSVCYNLESFGSSDEVGQQVAANMSIKNGDTVTQGQNVGNLYFGGDGAHIDFGIGAFGTRPCPEPYFTEEAKASVMRLIHKTQPTWPMCAN